MGDRVLIDAAATVRTWFRGRPELTVVEDDRVEDLEAFVAIAAMGRRASASSGLA